MSELHCNGCGAKIAADAPSPFRCPNAGDAGDHVVVRTLDPATVRFPPPGGHEANPFVRYRALTHAHALWMAAGRVDADFVELVRGLDTQVEKACGTGFVATPCARSEALSTALGLSARGGAWVKNETKNVSGSHKARHLMGLALLGEVRSRLGIASSEGARLAIASCGNAALAAAVVARAWDKPLDVFIPSDANAKVVAQLEALGATIHVCARKKGVAGDPCYHAFVKAVAAGALPFCCQGSDNGLTIEGGETLGWEMITALLVEKRALGRLFVQVGGGALASSCVQAFRDARTLGIDIAMPRIHAIQTEGCHPLQRAWEKLAKKIGGRLELDAKAPDAKLAAGIRAEAGAAAIIEEELAYAARHRAEFMWAWEKEPKSVAHGILDDETYDWLSIVRGMLETGGYPILVGDKRLREATALGHLKTGIDADETGTAGLAGVLELRERDDLGAGESIGVIFSGAKR